MPRASALPSPRPRKKPPQQRAQAPKLGLTIPAPRAALLPAPRSTSMDESPRGRILRAAAHLFLVRGYAQTTVRDLARAVGILSGSIFHHFDNKEEILEAVMTEVSTRSTERMQLAAAEAGSQMGVQPSSRAGVQASAHIARVRALISCELESIHGETSEAMTLLVTEWRSLSSSAQARVLVVRDRYEEVWLSTLRAASSELAALDPFILRRLIWGMTSGTASWYRPRGPLSIEALTEQVVLLIARAEVESGARAGHASRATSATPAARAARAARIAHKAGPRG